MTYRNDPAAIQALVREAEVHRDVYTSSDVFALEMERLFANTWVYVGHDSQVPKVGDFFTTTIGSQPVVMVRDADGAIRRGHGALLYARSKGRPDDRSFPPALSPPGTAPPGRKLCAKRPSPPRLRLDSKGAPS